MDDSAVTGLDRPVRIDVLSNDIAPQGGTLNPASIQVTPTFGGEFELNDDGSLTFTPDPGFTGTATTDYRVTDNWDMGVRAEITITVNAANDWQHADTSETITVDCDLLTSEALFEAAGCASDH